jgi:hypothetical protein
VSNNNGAYTLQVITNPAIAQSALKLSGNGSAASGIGTVLHGSLTVSSPAIPAGTTISVTRSGPGGTTILPPEPVAGNGSFTVTDTPVALGAYTYTARYAGSAQIDPATANFTITVALDNSSFTLSGPPTVPLGAPVTLSGTLTLGGLKTPGILTVTVTRTGPASKTFHLLTKANGTFALTDPGLAKGNYRYAASFAGNARTKAAAAARTVTVARTTPSLSISTSAKDYIYGTEVPLTVALGATLVDRTVSVYAKPAGESTVLLKSAKVDASGKLVITYPLTRNTTFTAAFAGDVHNGPATAERSIAAHVKIQMSNSGYFRSEKIDGTTYRVYHSTGRVNASVTVSPNNQGQCVSLNVMEYTNLSPFGEWLPSVTISCMRLDKGSKLGTFLNLGALVNLIKPLGGKFRLQAEYDPGKGATNITTDSPWFYFTVVK